MIMFLNEFALEQLGLCSTELNLRVIMSSHFFLSYLFVLLKCIFCCFVTIEVEDFAN